MQIKLTLIVKSLLPNSLCRAQSAIYDGQSNDRFWKSHLYEWNVLVENITK